MRVLGPKSFGQALTEWAVHEVRGRFKSGAALDALPPAEGRFRAVRFLLKNRRDVIAAIVAAQLVDCVSVEVQPDDLPLMLTMGAVPLDRLSSNMIAAPETDESGRWVRRLAAADGDVAGPFLGIARDPAGPVTLLDGLHRAAAWVAHAKAGRHYPILVDVAITAEAAYYFELPMLKA